MKKNKTLFVGLLVIPVFIMGCLTIKDPTRNNIGEIIGDDFALVRAPVVEQGAGLEMTFFAGNDLTVWNKYKVTSRFMNLGGVPTIDLKVTPGTHEFTIAWYV